MSLLSLPNELLFPIIEDIVPENFAALTLTCKRLRSFVAQYKTTRDRYRFVDPGKGEHPHTLLHKIWQDPCVARYVKTAKFRARANSRSRRASLEPVAQMLDYFLVDDSYMARAGDPLSRYIQDRSIPNRRAAMLVKKDRYGTNSCGAAFSILITLLPNLETLYLQDPWKYSRRWLDPVISAIADDFACPTNPLGNLHTVHLDGGDESYTPFETIYALMALPSIKRLSVSGCHSRPNLLNYHWPEGLAGSRLQELVLSGNIVDCPVIEKLLHKTPQLRSFTFLHGGPLQSDNLGQWNNPIDEINISWSLLSLLPTLGRTVASCLEELNFTTTCPFAAHAPVGTMRAFQRLQKLEISANLLPLRRSDLFIWRRTESMPVTLREIRLHVSPQAMSGARLRLNTNGNPLRIKWQLLPNLAVITLVYSKDTDTARVLKQMTGSKKVVVEEAQYSGYCDSD